MASSSPINRKVVRELALAAAADRFHNIPGYQMNRVAESFIDDVEAEVRLLVGRKVRALPSQGQTIK